MDTDTLIAEPALFELFENHVGKGVVARRAWRRGDTICSVSWERILSRPSRWTVQCGLDEHGELLPIELRSVNHSCSPNVQLDLDTVVLRALRRIRRGDELTLFYPATEWQMAEPFDCRCGSKACVGRIAGAAHLAWSILERHTLSPVIHSLMSCRAQR